MFDGHTKANHKHLTFSLVHYLYKYFDYPNGYFINRQWCEAPSFIHCST